jgi:hypothetical protein
MKKSEVEVGKNYLVKVSGNLCSVKVTGESPYGGWIGRNTVTGREVRIRTAARLRRPLSPKPQPPVTSQVIGASTIKNGAVCFRCGRTVTEAEYSCGESTCCHADVIPEEEYGKAEVR